MRRTTWLAATMLLWATAVVACASDDTHDAGRAVTSKAMAFTGDVAAFYVPPDPLPQGTHGDLIRYQRYEDDRGRQIYRVMYLSESVAGAPIAVTGLVALPAGAERNRVVLAWAHPTTGIADACAPSKQGLGIVSKPLDLFLSRNWIVAATDYEGMGTPGRHPYIAGVSEGRSVLDAVRAASQVPKAGAGDRTLVWGHSQGGHAAMFAAELARRWTPERRILGTVAGAPPSHFPELFRSLESSPYRGYLALAAAGLHAAYPKAPLGDILTAKGLALLTVVDRGCSDDVQQAFRDVPVRDFLKVEPSSASSWRSVLAANEPGRARSASPLLLIHGDKDEQIPPDTSRELFVELCRKGQVVERRTYAGQSHAGVIIPSFLPMLAWMDDRVAGRPATSGCKE